MRALAETHGQRARLVAEFQHGQLAARSPVALDTLWVVTGFAADDEPARGRSLPTARVAELLAGIAEERILAR